MKLHQMQALVAVADAGSIRAAARLEGLSQAAVTKALRELELEVKLPLLVRTASGVALTEAGQRLLGHARLVVGQLARANDDLAVLRGERVGTLSLSVTPWIMLTFLPRVLTQFRQRMPELQRRHFQNLALFGRASNRSQCRCAHQHRHIPHKIPRMRGRQDLFLAVARFENLQ